MKSEIIYQKNGPKKDKNIKKKIRLKEKDTIKISIIEKQSFMLQNVTMCYKIKYLVIIKG